MLAIGKLPYYVANENDGGYLTPSSFVVRAGQVPVNWNHWDDDAIGEEYTFTNLANFYAGEDGLHVWHVLDVNSPYEYSLIDVMRHGRALNFSYGLTPGPVEARAADIAYRQATIAAGGGPLCAGEALTGLHIQHMAYGFRGAYPQEPIALIG